LGGAVVVTLYRLGFPEVRKPLNLTVADPPSSKPKGKATNSKMKPTPDGFIVTPYLKLLEEAMETDKENLIDKVRGIYGFKVTNGPDGAEGYWVINARIGKGKITYNGSGKCFNIF
jgi:sterol carrier protein 2